MTTTNIRRWGNSQGLHIPIEMLRKLGISVDSSVTLDLENNAIVIRKADPVTIKEAAFASLQKIRKDSLLQREDGHMNDKAVDRQKYLEYLDERYGETAKMERD